ncbi:MAG TPA: pyridoxal phosphate-dependent aminotransferase [Acholeplasma sp.]|nr:pyridoxal phosphate-dependent aminotransferase [Acholeplasma sp.]
MRFSKIIKPSPTLKLGDLARQKQAEGHKVISLALGEPDFKTPSYILDATSKAMYDGYTHYSTPQGLIELRKSIKLDYKKRFNANYDESEIIVFPGAKAAIFASLAALLEPNDEVIIISPYYVSYPPMIKLAEYEASFIDIPLNNDFSLPIDKIKQAININTKVLILNYPNNPTGRLLTLAEVKEVVNIVKNNNLHLISDEIYEKLIFGENKFISFASFPEIKDKTIIINGYSKAYAMTGFRIGYALASKEIVNKMNLFNQNTNTNTNTFVQRGVLSIYENEDRHIYEYNKILRKRIDYLHEEINKIPYFKGIKPEGGFYYFIDISKTKMGSTEFANLLIDKYQIVTTPGISFGEKWDNYIRISLSVSLETMKEAVKILKDIKL